MKRRRDITEAWNFLKASTEALDRPSGVYFKALAKLRIRAEELGIKGIDKKTIRQIQREIDEVSPK